MSNLERDSAIARMTCLYEDILASVKSDRDRDPTTLCMLDALASCLAAIHSGQEAKLTKHLIAFAKDGLDTMIARDRKN